ncbi:hypothetical protein [Tabrizicola sp.]|uniref:hypothetical protein n=1 Tax=Tabrizicola sp. TaxID=2005166 RepID=UPI003D2CE71B
MVNLSWRNERFKSENEVAGRFVGAYASTNDITGLATGTIEGFGVNAGLYGARKMESGLYLDYYMGAAAGRHKFGLNFVRPAGITTANGSYDYMALFLGSAISTETSLGAYQISPRLGFDAAWSPGGDAEVSVTRGGLEDFGDLSTGSLSGLRVFAELEFGDLLLQHPETLSFTPQLFCDRPIRDLENRCGMGAKLKLAHENLEDGSVYSILLSGEASESHEAYSLGIESSRPLLGGTVSGSGTLGADGAVSVLANYGLRF